jgi:peptidoglycan/LPS O-acetylase OafA/YrhL
MLLRLARSPSQQGITARLSERRSLLVTTSTAPGRAAVGGRDRYFDVLRFLCIVWVVGYHIFSTEAWLGFWPAMGLLFAISGSLMVRSLDRGALPTIKNRLQRLLPVLWLAGIIGVPLMFWHGWPVDERPPLWQLAFWVFPLGDPPGSEWATSLTEPLWYLRSIVWFILLSPLLLALFRRFPRTVTLLPLAVMVGYGLGAVDFSVGGEIGTGALTDGFTFLSLWLLGFAHREGVIRALPVWVVVGAGLLLTGAATWWAFTHQEEGSYDFNLVPTGQALFSFGFVLVLLRFSPTFSWVGRSRLLDRLITIVNGRAMVIYLWHNVAIELSYPVGDRLGVWDLGETAGTTLCAVIAVVLTIAGMLAFGWVEDVSARRRPQLLPSDLGTPTPVAPPAAATAAVPAAAPAPVVDVPRSRPEWLDDRYAADLTAVAPEDGAERLDR